MATDYISRAELYAAFCKASAPAFDNHGKATFIVDYVKVLETIPAADVRPVVRGKWEQKEVFEAKGHVDELQSAFCPVCQRYHTTPYSYYFTEYNFCPNCGADMRSTDCTKTATADEEREVLNIRTWLNNRRRENDS